jgi:ABC-type Na+ efflux pump permease subunit
MKRVLTLCGKELTTLWRDKAALFWVLFFPLLIGILFGSIFSGDESGVTASRLDVIDDDRSPESRALVVRLKNSPALRIEEPDI